MVRLKAEGQEYFGIRLDTFQFHYGTIKSVKDSTAYRLFNLFQFHYGTIKSKSIEADILNKNIFQFHYGTIKRLTLEKISALIFKNLANTKL